MSPRPLTFLLVYGGLFAAEILTWSQFRQSETLASPALRLAAAVHLGIAAAAAIAGSLWLRRASLGTRVTLTIFFSILAAVLPIAGVVVVGAMAWIFTRPAGDGLRPEDKYVFGNPEAQAARRESRGKTPELRPLAESMRSLGALEMEELIHGVKHLRPQRLTLHFLRRFQTDPHSNLQFAAQGIISGAFEHHESQLKTLTARLKSNPDDTEASLGIAEVLLEMASWTPDGDATADICRRDALEHLQKVLYREPQCSRALLLQARCHLELNESGSALAAIESLPDAEDEVGAARLLEMEAAFRSGDWASLPALARQIDHPPAEFTEALGFWSGAAKPPASLLPKPV